MATNLSMEANKPRCASCPTEFESLPDSQVLRRWASYDELNQSAETGCDLCALCRQYLAHRYTIELLQKDETDIELSVRREFLTLRCSAWKRSIDLPLMEAGEIAGQRPRDDIGTFNEAAGWLRNCYSSHRDCRAVAQRASRSAELPKRLIDLRGENILTVFNCKDRIEWRTPHYTYVKYCTLSYRWGDAAHSCVLLEPFNGDFEISIDTLPKTFRDAVTVARSLNIRYLWIDALCIVQPTEANDSEWLEEGSRMGSIYQNAIFTIAATAANHANQGFLEQTGSTVAHAKPVSLYQKHSDESKNGTFYIPINVPKFFDCVSHSRLNRRGWVVQE